MRLELTPKDEEKVMDARKFASKYVRPDNVRDGAIQTRIISVLEDDRYNRLLLELETGSQFALNDGNTNSLIKAFGHDTNTWIGREISSSLAPTRTGAPTRQKKKKPSKCARCRRKRKTAARRRTSRCHRAGWRRPNRSRTSSTTRFRFEKPSTVW